MSIYDNPLLSKFPSKSSEDDLLDETYSDKELDINEDKKEKLEKLMKFFDDHGIDYEKFDMESIPKLDLNKREAYPNQSTYMSIPGQHNTSKWLQAVREIFFKEKNGENRVSAIRRVTSGWNVTETFDFLNWLRFHEQGEHLKYKFANLWYESPDIPGYALQIKPDPVNNPAPQTQGRDIDFARDQTNNDSERKKLIEKQRNKIIGRLDSAEKLLRSPDGQIFSGKEFEALLETVYQLKKKIQMVNKVSTSTRLYEDMIVREGNILKRGGFDKAANILYSVADDPSGMPAATPPAPPTTSQGMPGGLPASPIPPPVGTDPVPAPMVELEPEEPQAPGIKEFLEGIETGKFTELDKNETEDILEVEDCLDVSDINDELLVTEAQAAPPDPSMITPPVPKPEAKAPPKKAPDLEVTEEDIKPKEVDAPTGVSSDFDGKVNALLANITVADVVAKLENLAKFYKTREAPRQLGIVDMMLDSLGLAAYFPSLAEATNKSLESNNYISTRVEDILSKLRGAMVGKDIDLMGGQDVDRPEVAGVKNKLQNDEEKEKNRKQMRKDQEAADLASPAKETPNIEINEDLGAPPAPPPV